MPASARSNNVVSYTEVWVSKLAAGPAAAMADGRTRRLRARRGLGRADRRGRRAGLCLGLERAVVIAGREGPDRPQRPVLGRGRRQPQQPALRDPRRPGARHGQQPHSGRQLSRPIPQKQVVFFTDRSLYRPGQTIYYKGIAILVDQAGRQLQGPAREQVDGRLHETSTARRSPSKTVVTNDYGSVSGNFTAPRDRLMGRMMIRADCYRATPGWPLSTSRNTSGPSSRSRWTPPRRPPGWAAKSSCKARPGLYRRDGGRGQGPLPRRPPGPLSRLVVLVLRLAYAAAVRRSQEIAHGTAETAADGTFKIQFIAKPDLSVRRKRRAGLPLRGLGRRDRHQRRNPFRPAGRAGRLHGPAGLAGGRRMAHRRQAARDHALRRPRLDGEPQKAEGALKIYRLKQPEKVVRPDILGERPMPEVRPSRPIATDRSEEAPQAALQSPIQLPRPIPPIPTPGNWARSSPNKASRPTPRPGDLVDETRRRGLSRQVRDAGPLRQEDHRPVAAERPGPRGEEVPHQGPEPGGRAEMDAGAGRGIHGPLGQRLRSGPGVHRDRASRQDRCRASGPKRARRSSRSSRR